MMMKKMILARCTLILGLAFFASNVFSQEFTTTTWKGTLNAGGAKLRLEIDVIEKGGEFTGELRSLDQGDAKAKATEIKIDSESFGFTVPRFGAKFRGKYAKDKTSVEGTFSQNGANIPLTLTTSGSKDGNTPKSDTLKANPKETLKEAWVGELKMGIMKPVMQFRIVTLASGKTAAYFDSITEGRTGFPATTSVDGKTLKFDVAKIKLTFRGELNEAGDEAKGTWSQAGRNIPLILKKQSTVYDSVNVWKNRPQRPVGPFPYDAEEVTFENKADNLTLAGTLTIPKKPGRHPVVVLISGSGPQDRDESLMEHKPFLVLADYLSRRGIAVLRYDDRGTAKSTGKFDGATTEAFARDASSAVEFLKTHERINPDEIGLAGHSEGGLIAPMVVGLRDDVAFVALLAATGVDGVAISISQSEAMLRAAGTPEEEIEIALAVNRAVFAVVGKAEDGADLTKELEQAIETVILAIPESIREEAGKNLRAAVPNLNRKMKSKWMRFFHSYDPRPALSNIQCPVLTIIGSKDTQVLPDLNMPEIQKALIKGGNNDFEMVEIEGLNHLFQKCETGAMGEYISIQETFNPQALSKIGDWIVEHTTPIN
ncbi:MAG: alpha/beta hydrolase [Mariniblastus sp.]|nr:alpha/beta hydrolase [Mariniblastus sp.]